MRNGATQTWIHSTDQFKWYCSPRIHKTQLLRQSRSYPSPSSPCRSPCSCGWIFLSGRFPPHLFCLPVAQPRFQRSRCKATGSFIAYFELIWLGPKVFSLSYQWIRFSSCQVFNVSLNTVFPVYFKLNSYSSQELPWDTKEAYSPELTQCGFADSSKLLYCHS